jgi:HEPN domain-containing protein
MKRSTKEWIKKAEGDWRVTRRERQAASPVWEAVGFHAQQCAEKYVKAFLEEHNVRFEKIHDLVVLPSLTARRLPELEAMRGELGYLTPFATVSRYPGAEVDAEMADRAINIAERARRILRVALGIVRGT